MPPLRASTPYPFATDINETFEDTMNTEKDHNENELSTAFAQNNGQYNNYKEVILSKEFTALIERELLKVTEELKLLQKNEQNASSSEEYTSAEESECNGGHENIPKCDYSEESEDGERMSETKSTFAE